MTDEQADQEREAAAQWLETIDPAALMKDATGVLTSGLRMGGDVRLAFTVPSGTHRVFIGVEGIPDIERDEDFEWELRRELRELKTQLASPPPGWSTFGTHADQEAGLEFWGDDGDGTPLWERRREALGE